MLFVVNPIILHKRKPSLFSVDDEEGWLAASDVRCYLSSIHCFLYEIVACYFDEYNLIFHYLYYFRF